MKSRNDLNDLSVQNLLSMELDESIVKKCIDEAKSPLQTLHFDRTSATDGFDRNNHSTRAFWQTEQGRHRVSSFMLNDVREPATESVNLFPHRSRDQTSRDRSKSRQRKPIFSDTSSNRSDFWPSLCKALGDLFEKSDTRNNLKPNSPAFVPVEQRESTYRLPRIPENPLSPVSPLDESLRYQNQGLVRHQQEFIEFVLRILPKLCLKETISGRIYANKSELLQTIINKLEHDQKHQVLGTLFGNENVRRIDRRLKSSNIAEFLSRLVNMSHLEPKVQNLPIQQYHQRDILKGVERVVALLCEVEEEIQAYLATGDRVAELQSIYEAMNHLNFRQKSNERPNQALLATFEAYLQRNNINCTMADLEPLNYLWKDLQHRFYTKEAFVSELVRNDYNVRQSTSKEEDLEAELARQGFRRNA